MLRKFLFFTMVVASAALFLLAAGCPGGAGSLPPGGQPGQSGLRVDVTPLTASVQLSESRQFTATVVNHTNQSVTWSVPGSPFNGTVDATGLYLAPSGMPANPTVKIRATSVAQPSEFGEATITLVPGLAYGGFPIEMQVGTSGNWLAAAAPVTSGVPLPKGLAPNINVLRVTTSTGGAVPAQFKPLSLWSDGSLRWVKVDFLANMNAGIANYVLNNGGTGNAAATSLTVTSNPAEVNVVTGPLEFTVSKTAFRLFQSVKVDRDNNGTRDECLESAFISGVVLSDAGTPFTMDKVAPDSIEVEETGPIRCCIRAEGRFRMAPAGVDKLRWIARIHAYNGLPWVKVCFSIVNRGNDGQNNSGDPATEAAQLASLEAMDSIVYRLPIKKVAASDPVQILVGGANGPHQVTLATAGEFGSQRQTYVGQHNTTSDAGNPQPPGYTGPDGSSETLIRAYPTGPAADINYVLQGALTTVSGNHAPGYMQSVMTNGSDELRTIVAVRDFWQNYPKQFSIDFEGNMTTDLWPQVAGQRCQIFEGVMKTHDMLFSFERFPQVDAATGAVLANFINDPPMAAVHPRHFKATRAWGNIGTTDASMTDVSRYDVTWRQRVTQYLNQLKAWFNDLVADRDNGNGAATGHAYGFFNWGDCKTEDVSHSWDNHDWSIAQACFNWFAASRRRDMFLFGDVALRHYRDICVIHSDVGRRYSYSEPSNPGVGPWGTTQKGKSRATPNNRQHDMGNFNEGLPNLEGLKGQMLAHHYLLTGDALSLDVLRSVYHFTRSTWKRFFDTNFGGTDTVNTAPLRHLSNALLLSAAYFSCTNENPARDFAQYCLFKARARQNASFPNDPTGKGFPDNTGYFQSFVVGHMLEAMDYYRFVLEDPTVDTNLLNGMDWIVSSSAAVYSNGSFGESAGSTVNAGFRNLLLGAGFAAAWRAGGGGNWQAMAADFLDIQQIELQNAQDVDIRHKTFAQAFRNGPQFLAVFEP